MGELRAVGWMAEQVSRSPPLVLAPDEIEMELSPETDLRSSSVPDGGEIGSITRESNDVDRSRGESEGR